MNKKFYYFSRINIPNETNRLGESVHIGPAYKKVISVSEAIACTGVASEVITVPVFRVSGRIKFQGKIEYRIGNVSIQSWAGFGVPVLDRIYALFIFLYLSVKLNKFEAKILLYNFFPEYIFAAIYLHFVNNKAIIDIEDAPRQDEPGLRGFINRVSYKILRFFTSDRCVTVSEKIANDLNLKYYKTVYGVANSNKKEKILKHDGCINVLYGGSLMRETGLDIFLECCDYLFNHCQKIPKNKLRITVTGFGDVRRIKKYENISNKWISLKLKSDVSFTEYDEILGNSHASLCLKIPGTGIGDTTFPSKVVEIVSSGVLLVSTPVSDVPKLFNNSNAVLLSDPYSNNLSECLWNLANDPEPFFKRADAGFIIAEKIFEKSSVGESVVKFIFK